MFLYAIADIPLASAMLLKLTAPLSRHVIAALAVGFGGVSLILVPDFSQVAPVATVALLGGALAGLAKVTVRKLSATEPTARTVFYFAAVGSTASLVPLLWMWQTPSATHLAWLLLLGILATAGQMLLTRGMACAPAARLGPVAFFSVIFGALLGWLFWEEVLTWPIVIGALLVISSAILAGRGMPHSSALPAPAER